MEEKSRKKGEGKSKTQGIVARQKGPMEVVSTRSTNELG